MNTKLEPAAWWSRADNGNIRLWTSSNEDGLRLAVEAGFKLEPLYDEATVRAMIENAWRSGYADASFTNDKEAYADKQARDFADSVILVNARHDYRHGFSSI